MFDVELTKNIQGLGITIAGYIGDKTSGNIKSRSVEGYSLVADAMISTQEVLEFNPWYLQVWVERTSPSNPGELLTIIMDRAQAILTNFQAP